MARIVELTYPDNVTLVPGAVQNWVDLDSPAAATPLHGALVDRALARSGDRPVRRCLVVGAHDPALLHRLAARVDQLVVVVRAIPDAARIGTELPAATIRCGSLAAACAGDAPYDLVVALDDLARVLSLEDDQRRPWRGLADTVLSLVAADGTLLLGVENELGVHRVTAPLDPRMRDDDANWSPLATWDATRPRTSAAVGALLAATGRTGTVHHVFPDWAAPTVAGAGLDTAPRELRDLLAALTGLPGTDGAPAPGLLHRRALALADTLPDACAGWVLEVGAAASGPELLQAAGTDVTRWTATGTGRVRGETPGRPDRELAVPQHGATVLVDLAEAAVDSDTPRLRALLTAWRSRLESVAVDGTVPAAYAEARFATLLPAVAADPSARASGAVSLLSGAAPAPLDEVVWSALVDLLTTWRAAGLRHPWPSSMHPSTVFLALVAMAGARAPEEPAAWGSWPHQAQPGTRQELAAVVERQREELRGAWSRFHWDETDYLAYKASRFTRRTVRFVRREGLRRTLGRLKRLLRS